MSDRSWKKWSLLLAGMLTFSFISCQQTTGTPERIETNTEAVYTITPEPTNTDTPEPTPSPTQTGTPFSVPNSVNLSEDATRYYPLNPFSTWWYFVYIGGELVGISGISVVELEESQERVSFVRETVYSGVRLIVEHLEMTPERVLLTRVLENTAQGYSSDNEFDPPIPRLIFPITVGDTWEWGESHVEVVRMEDVSTPFGDFDDCYLVERRRNNIPDWRDWYCVGVGRVAYEFINSKGEWMRHELIDVTSGRLRLDELSVNEDGSCGYLFVAEGFNENEPVDFTVIRPDDSIHFDSAELGLPFTANHSFSFVIGPEELTGYWFVEMIGTENWAYYALGWGNGCMEY